MDTGNRLVMALAVLLITFGVTSCGGSGGSGGGGSLVGSSVVAPTATVSPTAVNPTQVTNLSDSGAGSLRDAINAANALKAPNTVISFKVSGTIPLASALPVISTRVTIDGTTAPGFRGTAPVVGINANGNTGLIFGTGSASSQMLAIAIGGASGSGVTLNAGSITLNLNYIGLSTSGSALPNSGDGLFIASTSANDVIGLNPSGASGVVANVISANGGNGVNLNGCNNNVLVANRIGTTPDGSAAIPNGANGILITSSATLNTIGGTIFTDSATGKTNDPTGQQGTIPPTFIVPPQGNLVSGNRANGILINGSATENNLEGNFIGTNQNGTKAIPNSGDGVRITGADYNALTGCTLSNNPFVYYNVISGNGGNGLRITNSAHTTVQGNFFGINATNNAPLANANDGILVDGTSTYTFAGGPIPLGNVVSGNANNGIEIAGVSAGFISYNNFTGLTAFGGAIPNGNDGYLITANPPLAPTQIQQTIQTCVSSGNKNHGVEITGDAWGVLINPAEIGTNTDGNASLPNGGDGVLMSGNANLNVIGSGVQSIMVETTISCNARYGVEITGNAHNNQVFGTYLGTDTLGTAALQTAATTTSPAYQGNQLGGIFIGGAANNNLIGGGASSPVFPQRNVISGNNGIGVTLGPGSFNNQVLNNIIGFRPLGNIPLPNKGVAIFVDPLSTGNTITGNSTFP